MTGPLYTRYTGMKSKQLVAVLHDVIAEYETMAGPLYTLALHSIPVERRNQYTGRVVRSVNHFKP